MRLIIGSYRGLTHLPDALASIEKNVRGVTDLVIIDDSGDPEISSQLRQYGTVIAGGGKGFANTMQLACNQMIGSHCAFAEEDFTFDVPVDLNELADELDNDPTLAQVALLRQPWFPNEIEAGGLIEALETPVDMVEGVHSPLFVQDQIFTTNPAVWSPRAWFWGWPQCNGSEDVKSMQLREHDGLRFAWRAGIAVTHYGTRQGHGY